MGQLPSSVSDDEAPLPAPPASLLARCANHFHLRLSTRLFLALAATGVLISAVTVFATRLSFARGFLGYLNNQSVEQLKTLVPRFQTAYDQHRGFRFLVEDHALWFRYIQPSYIYQPGPPPKFLSHPPPPPVVLTGLFNRVALLDPQLRRIVGDPFVTSGSPRVPIKAHGRIVGWLAVAPFESVSGPADLEFQHEQYVAMWIIASAAIVLAALVASLLARSLSHPLRRVAHAMHRLAAGDYAQRLSFTGNDEVGQLAQDVNDLASTLRRNENTRRLFMADISHELRTPVAILRGTIDAVEDRVRMPTRETLLSLKAEVMAINKLVEDLYQLSLSDRGALAYRKSRVDVGKVLRLAVGIFRGRLADRGLQLESHIPQHPVMFEGDETRLLQLFNNILENAVRYANPDGKVRVHLTIPSSKILIDFEDSGPGVPDSLRQHLFERSFRIDSTANRATTGAGLGLTICSNIVEAHGGTICAQASALGGLWIRISLSYELMQVA